MSLLILRSLIVLYLLCVDLFEAIYFLKKEKLFSGTLLEVCESFCFQKETEVLIILEILDLLVFFLLLVYVFVFFARIWDGGKCDGEVLIHFGRGWCPPYGIRSI